MKMIKLTLIAALSTVLLACSNTDPAPIAVDLPEQDPMAAALSGANRTEAFKARDSARNPAATLAFFQVEPQLSVVEIWPGGGWYTEILAPYLRAEGKLYTAHFHPEATAKYFQKSRSKFEAKLAANPTAYDRVEMTVAQPGLEVNMAPAGTADRVLTFRNVHNWMKAGTAQEVFDGSFAALKPGGLFGVVEHRANEGSSWDYMVKSGYVSESKVKEYAKAAGFEFVGSSEVNANSSDIKQYPAGVWSLPPRLRLGDEDRAYYVGIGESDRMTLLFKKPE